MVVFWFIWRFCVFCLLLGRFCLLGCSCGYECFLLCFEIVGLFCECVCLWGYVVGVFLFYFVGCLVCLVLLRCGCMFSVFCYLVFFRLVCCLLVEFFWGIIVVRCIWCKRWLKNCFWVWISWWWKRGLWVFCCWLVGVNWIFD